jgi:hypothetical protein
VIFELLVLVSAGLFTGAALYVSLVEHPARLSCPVEVAIAEWRPSYRRATVMQASLAVVALLAALAAFLSGRGTIVLVGGVLIALNIPVTFGFIMPLNHQLKDPALDPTDPAALDLLVRWGRLHGIRTVIGLVAFVLLAGHATRWF